MRLTFRMWHAFVAKFLKNRQPEGYHVWYCWKADEIFFNTET